MEPKKNNNKGFSSIISSVATRTPLDLVKEQESDELEINQENNDDLVVKDTKSKGKANSKEKLIEFLTDVTSSNLKDKSQIHISTENVNKIKLLSSLSGLNMSEISDGIVSKFIEEHKAEIKKLISSQL